MKDITELKHPKKRLYYLKHKDRIRDVKREYNRKNKEKIAVKRRIWNKNHSEERRAYARKWHSQHKLQSRKYRLFTRFRITPEDYQNMRAVQEARCAICREVLSDHGHIDHCHKSGVVRGILCRFCNNGLGLFQDSPVRLKQAIQYLEGVKA